MPVTYEEVWKSLDSSKSRDGKKKVLLTAYVRELIAYLPESDDKRMGVACDLAGLLATRYAIEKLRDGDPLEEILSMASSLELPEEHRAGATWDQLIRAVDQLS